MSQSSSPSLGRSFTTHGGRSVAIDPVRLSDIIGAIYDCVLDPANWPAALRAVCDEFSFDSSILGVERLTPMAASCQYTVGIEPEWLARIPDYLPEILELWGGVERMQSYPLDEPIVNSQAVDRAMVENNRYAWEWRKRGICDAVAIVIGRDPSFVGSVAFNRHEVMGPVSESEIDGLRLLGPHFRRAVTISNLFEMKAVEAATFASVIDAFSCGLLLIDERQGIVHANPSATTMLAARDPLESRKGSLVLHDKDAACALQRALDAVSNEAALGARGIGIPVRRAGGAPCIIHMLPLRSDELRSRFGQRASAALFVVPAAAPIEAPMAALTLLHDLTPAEARVYDLLVRGMTLRAISERIGIAPSTVKTHVLRLYAKTGCRRQVDLIALARDLSLPL